MGDLAQRNQPQDQCQIDLQAHRAQYSALANKQYFNYGGQGPLAEVALGAIAAAYRKTQALGPFSGAVNGWVAEVRQDLRQAMAAELGCTAAAITLTEDVTVGCNIPLWGQDWQPGDHILLSDCEHPGIIATVQELQRRFGLEVSICPLMATLNGGDPAAVIGDHLRPSTRLVVISHILWNTGQVLPLKAIMATCQGFEQARQPVRVLVDAAQSVGVLPLDLTDLGVDYYAFTGHKWWCGPEGVGGLYVRPEIREALSPTYIGWRGILYGDRGQPAGWQPNGQRYEVATSAYPLYVGLQRAMEFQNQWGNAQARYDRLLALSAQLWQQLQGIPAVTCLRQAAPESGLVSFQLGDRRHGELVRHLESQQIYVRQIADPDCVRACVHYLTLEEEVAQLVGAIAQFCA
ncbi:MAG: aminotransferase class V-fold PLP-dependent enzyme [Synechococcales cyanobacterium RM1_1_8]|nr:aminotransferase class V-fold PLP-dependent enzyme [Synechococcales cyanobacterium RM1_1_8]